LVMALMITFSGFKLPHYINIIFPSIAVLTAAFLIEKYHEQKLKSLFSTQLVICILCLIAAAIINAWAFPIKSISVLAVTIAILAIGIFILRSLKPIFQKIVGLSVLTSAFIFYLLNANFYPQLLTYQAGNELALSAKNKVNPKQVFIWPGVYNPSFQFYSRELKKDFADSVLLQKQPVWILTERRFLSQFKEKNLPVLEQYIHHDYNIGTMSFPFINPSTRKKHWIRCI
jgi:4-amino-4-deoxy-L-arabinose transferase-like glycosyltransferase